MQVVRRVRCESPGLSLGTAFETGELEYCRGVEFQVAVEMRRDLKEYEWRPWTGTDARMRRGGKQLDTW